MKFIKNEFLYVTYVLDTKEADWDRISSFKININVYKKHLKYHLKLKYLDPNNSFHMFWTKKTI